MTAQTEAAPEAPRTGGSRTTLVVGLVLTLVVAGLWGGWALWSSRAADQVSVTWALECDGTTVGRHRGHPAIRSRPGWRCDVLVSVRNGSGRDVELLGVEAPLLGPTGGAEVRGFSTPDGELREAPFDGAGWSDFGDVDAAWVTEATVSAGQTRDLELAIGWRPKGCNSAGHIWHTGWPTVVVDILGRHHRVSAGDRLVLRTFDDPHDAVACPT